MTIRVLAVGNANTTQTDHRSLISSLTAPSGSNSHRSGFFPTFSVGAISNASSMVAAIGPFKCVISNSSGAGAYLVQSDDIINLTFDPGEAGVTRTDRIIVRVYNNPQDGSGFEKVELEYLKGQSSGSASAMPANSLLMWEVPVPAGASSGGGGINFPTLAVDKRTYTAASGGVLVVNNTSDLNAISNAYDGMVAYSRGTDILYIYDGTLWRPKGQIGVANAAGLTSIANPEDGTLAVAKDTDTLYRYSGSQWLRPPGTHVTEVVRTSVVGPFTAETILDSVTIDAVAGEKYRIVWDGSVQVDTVNNNIQLKLKWISGTTITGTTGTVVRLAYPNADVASRGQPLHMEKVINPNITGKVTIAASCARGSGTGQVLSYGNATQQENSLQVFVA